MVFSSARMPPRGTRSWCRAGPDQAAGCGPEQSVGAWELSLLDLAVEVEPRDPFGAKRVDMATHRGHVAETGAADFHSEVADPRRGSRSGGRLFDPPRQLSPAGFGDGVHLLVGAPVLAHRRGSDPAVVLHRAQRAIDLLVGGTPEEADRSVEPACQLVAGAGLFGQRHQDRVCQAHAPQPRAWPRSYATCCTSPRRIVVCRMCKGICNG